MTQTPVASLAPNTYAFETTPLVKPTGFREYDARWWFGHPASEKPPELNLIGLQNIGSALGALVRGRWRASPTSWWGTTSGATRCRSRWPSCRA